MEGIALEYETPEIVASYSEEELTSEASVAMQYGELERASGLASHQRAGAPPPPLDHLSHEAP